MKVIKKRSIEEPIFLVGSERSGTTLLRLMLDSHPNIAFNLESEFLVTKITDEGQFPKTTDYKNWLENDRVFRHSKFEVKSGLTYKEMVNDFLYQKLERDRKELVGATVHFSFDKLPLIWPEAKFIYLYRDGRDVANSVVQMGWAGNPYVAAEWWIDAEKEWELLSKNVSSSQRIELKFEDLAVNSDSELKRLCNFLNVKYSVSMYDYVKDSTYGLPDANISYQWKNKMSKKDLQLVEGRIGNNLKERGYELSGFPPLVVGAFYHKLIQFSSRVKCLRHRLFKYGFFLVLQEIISRRLKLYNWHRNIQSQIDSIIDSNIR